MTFILKSIGVSWSKVRHLTIWAICGVCNISYSCNFGWVNLWKWTKNKVFPLWDGKCNVGQTFWMLTWSFSWELFGVSEQEKHRCNYYQKWPHVSQHARNTRAWATKWNAATIYLDQLHQCLSCWHLNHKQKAKMLINLQVSAESTMSLRETKTIRYKIIQYIQTIFDIVWI